jgi:PBSX family phage portal protein
MSAAEDITTDELETEVTLIKAGGSLESVMKDLLGSGSELEIQRSNLVELSDQMQSAFEEAGAIEPPLDPLSLVRLSARSATLSPLVQAMAINVHGFGHRFDPVIDLDSSDAKETVKEAMMIEAEEKAEREAKEGEEPDNIQEPTEDEITERVESLKSQAKRELAKLKAFFRNASQEVSFSRLGRKLKTDEETTGYAAWEARRDTRGRLRRLKHSPSWTIRALPLSEPTRVTVRERSTDISWRDVEEDKRYRRFVQIYEDKTVYFKEFGDKRIMSSVTGEYFEDEKELAKENKGGVPATELIWFALDNPESDIYGQVRWSGCTPGILGNREQAEVSLLFWRSKAIPPMVIMVSGGKLAKGAKEKLQDILDNEIKGSRNFHKVILLEAESNKKKADPTGALPSQDKVTIEIRPLIDAIWSDAIWRGYVQDNRNEQGQAFRFPPMIRGDLEKLNRATAQIGKELVEQQVFQPERNDFSWIVDQTILADLGISLWTFKLNGPELSKVDQLVEFVTELANALLTINEGRTILGQKVFNKELPVIDADWARMPLKQSLAGMLPEDPEEDNSSDESEEELDSEPSKSEDSSVLKIAIPEDDFRQLVVAD